jgi:hypothetical protein
MSTNTELKKHLLNVSQNIVINDPGCLVQLFFELAFSIHAIGGIMTGSAHPLFKGGVHPNDFDFIIPGSWENYNKRLREIAGQLFDFRDRSFFYKESGKKVIDLIFVRKPPKVCFIDGVRCVEPKLLLWSYQQNDEDREGKNDCLKLSIIKTYIGKHPQVQASCSTRDETDTDTDLVSVCRQLF